jgi:hypothetical protein
VRLTTRNALLLTLLLAVAPGCTIGPRSLERSRLRYNEAVKATGEEQLLLNIVRLRYTDNTSSLAVSTIADQSEISGGLHATPFFQASAAGLASGGYRGLVLPAADLSGASRPTLSYTPLDDQEFTRRFFTPITLEGMAYIAKTTWPIATVFRLYLENLNWASNAETASGPTPRDPPVYADFLSGILALQRLHDRRLASLWAEEKEERLSDPVPSGTNSPTAAVDAAKADFEYRKDGNGFAVVKKKPRPVLRLGDIPANDPDFAAFCKAFKLDPSKRTFELTTDKLDPFYKDMPKEGLLALDLETRSLLQVLFFAAHGVDVPPAHIVAGVAPATVGPDGVVFDWQQVLGGLFRVYCAEGKKPPPCAHVAVCYRGYWFYIDERDRDSKATFALLLALSRMEVGGKSGGSGPLLTLPLGGK